MSGKPSSDAFCVKCRKLTGNIKPILVRSKTNRKMISATCEVCGTKKNKFVKDSFEF